MKTIPRSVLLPMAFCVSGLAACSLFREDTVDVRPVENFSKLTLAQRDPLYESAVTAINARDYGRALDYLHEAHTRDPRNVKALNALGVIYDKLGRFDLSARYYAEARAVDPSSRIVAQNIEYSKTLRGLAGAPSAIASANAPPLALTPETAVGESTVIRTSGPRSRTSDDAGSVVREVQNTIGDNKLAGQNLGSPQHGAADLALLATLKVEATPQKADKTLTQVDPLSVPATTTMPAAIREPAVPLMDAISRHSQQIAVLRNDKQRPIHKPIAAVPVAGVATDKTSIGPVQEPRVAEERKVLTIGGPVKLVDATGQGLDAVWRRLTSLHWSLRASTAPTQQATILFFRDKNSTAAKAMQRTLPFPVRLVSENGPSAMRLVVGRDYLTWMPKNIRLALLWRKGVATASLQKMPIKGVH